MDFRIGDEVRIPNAGKVGVVTSVHPSEGGWSDSYTVLLDPKYGIPNWRVSYLYRELELITDTALLDWLEGYG